MKELIYKIKSSKILLATFICCVIIFFADIALFVFDCVELILVSKNSASLSGVFLGLNIAMIVLNGLMLILIVVWQIVRKFYIIHSKEK